MRNFFNMAKVKYYYDTKTLSYKRIQLSRITKIKKLFYFLIGSSFTGLIMGLIFFQFFDSPKEKILNREIIQLSTQYTVIKDKLNQVELVLDDIQERDDNIYRVIFAAEPIPNEVRLMGIGGDHGSRYRQFDKLETKDLIVHVTEKVKFMQRRIAQQSKSYDEIAGLAQRKNELIATIPAIQPVANKDLKRISSGFGWRTDPHYKTKKFHAGLDFSAPIGTPIYATGDGVIEKAIQRRYNTKAGLGNFVKIKHGYGYQTLYGHMSKVVVRKGQKVKRGQIIGYVGNTGKSTAAHLHYEVVRNGKKVNPVDFFYNDLSPEQYAKVIEMASKGNQPFD